MRTYFRLLRFLRPHLGIFGIAISCMLVSSVLGGVELGGLIPLADRIMSNQAIPAPAWLPGWIAGLIEWMNTADRLTLLTSFALAIPVIYLLKGLFEFLQTFYINDASQLVLRDLRQAIFNRFMGLSMDYHQQQSTGNKMSRILYDTSVIQNSMTEGVYDLFYQSFQIAIYLGIALAIHAKLTLIIFLVVPLIAWPIINIGKVLKKLSQQAQVAMGDLSTTILESMSGVQVIQAFLAEGAARKKFAADNQRFYRITRRVQKRMNLLAPTTEIIGICGGAVVFWFGGRAVLAQELTLGTFMVFLGAILSLIRPFKRLSRLHSVNQQALSAGDRIFEVLDAQPSVLEHAKARVLPPFQRDIAYEHVSFHYDSKPALRGVSLTIQAGEVVALVGPSGGGKTTFVNLLSRFYDPQAGRVRIDGLDIKHVTLESLRGQIGLVTQETMLFQDTVRANLAIGRPAAHLDEIVAAAKAANAHGFISQLPKGYDTVLGERGASLSGGERQRLAIARAFLKNPPILIFDEATSQLDAESEHAITEAIERVLQDRTVLLIAHRLSTVRFAHRIVLLQEGRIVEAGRHDELLHKSPLYRRFCELQLMHAGAGSEPAERSAREKG